MTNTKQNKLNVSEEDLEKISQMLDRIDSQVQLVRDALFISNHKQSAGKLKSINGANASNVIEGVFDGCTMVDSSGQQYQIPENYASKSKLVEGDVLKLTVANDGTYIYKQIGPVDRKKIIGVLCQKDDKYFVKTQDKKFQVLTASVTYFKAEPNDKITIIVPKNKECRWAAVENVIGK